MSKANQRRVLEREPESARFLPDPLTRYVEASPAEPALGFGLVLRPGTIASLLLDATPRSACSPELGSRPFAAPSALGVADATQELLDAVLRMLRLHDHPEDAAILAPLIEREILWRVMTGPLGQSVRQIGMADSSLTQISGAVRRIADHYDEPCRVEDLAASCGISTSAFHRAFTAVTASSPIRFQKHIRLHKARLLLVTEVVDVASAGYQVGYRSTT